MICAGVIVDEPVDQSTFLADLITPGVVGIISRWRSGKTKRGQIGSAVTRWNRDINAPGAISLGRAKIDQRVGSRLPGHAKFWRYRCLVGFSRCRLQATTKWTVR